MCSSSMAGEDGRGRRSCITVAVILVLCSLAPSLTCFSLRRLGESVGQDREVSEATVMDVRTGRILFNGKDLESQSGSASATENDGTLLDHSDGTGNWEQMSQLEDAMANEAAWRRLNPSLHCGQNKMKLKAMGPGAAHLKLQMGNAHPLPLIQVPETCGYLMKQNAMGLVLVVPYSGCDVIQENGNYVLPMSWLETPVKFTCPILMSPASTTPMPAQQPWKLPLPDGLRSLNRHKRQTTQSLPINDPRSPYFPYWYYYYLYRMTPTTAPGTALTTTTAKPDATETTTTAKPDTTTTTDKTMTTAKPDTTTTTDKTTTTAKPDTTTTKPTLTRRPAYPSYPLFLYYPYYPYYYPYYALPNVPARTTALPATTTPPPTTTTNATTGPTTTANTTTTAPASTTKTPQKPQNPYYRPYPYPYAYPYPHYPPAGQVPGMPDNPDIYYQIIQHYYGKPPYPQNPNTMLTTLPPATTTAKPNETTTTAKQNETTTTTPETTTTATTCNKTTTGKPDETTTTTTPETTTTTKPTDSSSTTQQTTDSSPTTIPTTASGSTTAPTTPETQPSTQTTKPSDEKYPGPLSPFSPYYQFPFPPYLAYKYSKAGKFPDDQKYMPQAGYKSGPQARAHPPPHPGFNHWQPVPWFPQATGQDMRPVDWKNLQPKQV